MKPTIRLLVIDDDPLQIELVERALSRDGFDVRGLTSFEGLATTTRELMPELVLLDVNMPDLAPERVIELVRDAAGTARIVLYSAWEEAKLRSIATKVGADGYISKSESVFSIADRLRALT